MAITVKTFYDPRMSCPSGSYSPSGEKPSAVVDDWSKHGLIEICAVEPALDEDIELAHAASYVRGIFAGRLPTVIKTITPTWPSRRGGRWVR